MCKAPKAPAAPAVLPEAPVAPTADLSGTIKRGRGTVLTDAPADAGTILGGPVQFLESQEVMQQRTDSLNGMKAQSRAMSRGRNLSRKL